MYFFVKFKAATSLQQDALGFELLFHHLMCFNWMQWPEVGREATIFTQVRVTLLFVNFKLKDLLIIIALFDQEVVV